MTKETVLLVVLLILFIGGFPLWPYSRSWGYAPSLVFTAVLIIFLVWAFAGGRPFFKSSRPSFSKTVQEAGQDMKSAGRDVADSIRDAVQ